MISIVIPTYKSENNLPLLLDSIKKVFNEIAREYEIIVVNDNSPDNTYFILVGLAALDKNIKVVNLSRNFGQQTATTAGLKYASGEAVIIMDDDLQDPPEFIPSLIEKWQEGFDIVYAIRKKRKEGLLKRIGYKLFYKTLAKLSDIKIPNDSGDFCIMSQRIVGILNNMPEQDRFLRGLRAWVGFKQIGIECERAKRHSGEPAYTLSKIIKLSLDGIFSFSNKPIKLTTYFGFIISLFAFIGILVTLTQKVVTFYYPNNTFAVWPGFSSILLSILFLGGVQLISIGILGEYIGRIFNEVKKRPLYLVKDLINLEEHK